MKMKLSRVHVALQKPPPFYPGVLDLTNVAGGHAKKTRAPELHR